MVCLDISRVATALAACVLLGAGSARAQSATDGELAQFFPRSVPGLSGEAPPWQPRVPGAPSWSWAPPECSLNISLGDHCAGYMTAPVFEQYFVVDSSLIHQMLALLPKVQAAQDRMMKGFQEGRTPTSQQAAEVGQLAHTQDSLKHEARFVTLTIKANAAPHVVPMGDSLVGSLHGHPLFRRATGGSVATLSVYVAPPGFVLGPSPDGIAHTEVKCVLVSADFPQRDEALAQALLDSVDYAGLMKLLHP
jgi:hypothetical protein